MVRGDTNQGGVIVGTLAGAGYASWKHPIINEELINEKLLEAAKLIVAAYTAGIVAELGDGTSKEKLYEIYGSVSGQYPILKSSFWRAIPDVGVIDLTAGNVWKYGTTKQDEVIKTFDKLKTSRYSQNQLGMGLTSRVIFQGNKAQVAFMEKYYIAKYVIANGDLPPGNKIFR